MRDGVALGLVLAAGDVCAGYVVGDRFPWQWCAFLAAYYGAAGGGLGTLFGVFGGSLRALFLALFFAYVGTVTLQEALPQIPLLSWPRLASLAAVAGATLACERVLRALERVRPAPRPSVPEWTLAFPLAISLAAGARVAPASPVAGVLWVTTLPLATVTAFAFLQGRTRAFLAATAMGGAAVAAWGLRESAPRFVRIRHESRLVPVAGSKARPNVVLVVLDTVRARSLSCYGHPHRTTPHLDSFARQAVLYGSCATPSPWSVPAHASLFTGLYPSRHGAHEPRLGEPAATGRVYPLPDEVDTLASILARAGYTTAGFSANVLLGQGYGLTRGFGRFETSESPTTLAFVEGPLLHRVRARLPYELVVFPMAELFPGPFLGAEAIGALAREWLSRDRPPERPYFLFLNFMDAHTPRQARRRIRKLDPEWPTSPRLTLDGNLPSALVDALARGDSRLTSAEARHLEALYDSALSYVDEQVGALLDWLRRRPDWENTLVVLTADHGEAVGEHALFGHDSPYQEVLHVPLIVRYPAGCGGARPAVDPTPAQLVDVLPTVLECAGLPPRADLDGVPLRGLRRWMLAESFPRTTRRGLWRDREWRSLTLDGVKYVGSGDGRELLFDLRTDPNELVDVARERPAAVAERRSILEAWARSARTPPRRAQPPLVDERALKALGYVQ